MYCTKAEIIGQRIPEEPLIQLTDDEEAGEVSESVIDEVIQGESNLIDGFLRGRYSLPLSSEQPILKTLCLDLVTYRLYARRTTFDVPDHVKKAQADSMSKLKMIANGQLKLEVDQEEVKIASVRMVCV